MRYPNPNDISARFTPYETWNCCSVPSSASLNIPKTLRPPGAVDWCFCGELSYTWVVTLFWSRLALEDSTITLIWTVVNRNQSGRRVYWKVRVGLGKATLESTQRWVTFDPLHMVSVNSPQLSLIGNPLCAFHCEIGPAITTGSQGRSKTDDGSGKFLHDCKWCYTFTCNQEK